MAMTERVVSVPASLSATAVAALAEAIELAMQDESTNVVVLRGSSNVFCRGLDLDELLADDDAGIEVQPILDYCRCLRALRFAKKPAIAAVQGDALGGGVGIVATCDVVIADADAKFGLPEALFGLAPAMVMPFLLERVSVHAARRWALTATARSAEEARSDGLVDVVVPASELDKELRRQVKTLRRALPSGVKAIKHLTSVVPRLDLVAALELGQQTTLTHLRDPATVAGIRRYRSEGVLPWESS